MLRAEKLEPYLSELKLVAPQLAAIAAIVRVGLPLGYWLGIVSADNPLEGTVAFWQSMIAGITVASMLVFGRLYWRLRQPLPNT